MRFWIDDDSDDEECEYPVSFTPIEPTRARALATLGKDINNNPAGAITPFDRMVLAYANGNLATHDQVPRVVETAKPQPYTTEPMVTAPRVESWMEPIVQAPRVETQEAYR